MPEELRKILFSKEEVQAAVVDYCLRAKIRLPNKIIEDLEVQADPKAMVVLKYADTGPEEADEVELSRDQVAPRRPHPLLQRHNRAASARRPEGPATGRRRHFPVDQHRRGQGDAEKITVPVTAPPARPPKG